MTETSEQMFESLNPATGEVVGKHQVHDKAAVDEAIARAHGAAQWWRTLGWKQRKRRLLDFKGSLTRSLGRVAELVHNETGKPREDAQLEVILAINHLDWAARNAEKVLGSRGVYPGMLALNQKCVLEYQPLGVVGVIGPWNYPIFTPMGSIAYALAAGNAVVFKPSEYTPGVGELVAEICSNIVPEQPVFQTVTGFGETGAALAAGDVNKIAFTGSTATAKRVMEACAKNLTPLVAECGGKDALIVDADADLDAAAEAATWGAMSNAGQTCIGVERIYAVESVYDEFVAKVTEQAASLRPGEDREASYGPITMPSQLDVIQRHISDAVERGGTAVTGGAEAVSAPFVAPTVLTDVPDDSAAVREETFGPTITVHKVKTVEEAVTRANASTYALASSVFSGSRGRAMDIARRLRSGMTSINAVLAYATVPALPFGGVGESGFGRIHGPDGLREFARAKAITRQRFSPPLTLTSFKRTEKDMTRVLRLTTLLHGRRHR